MAQRSIEVLRRIAVCASILFIGTIISACEESSPGRSTTSGSSGAAPTPTPSNLPPKAVTISWTASNAKQVAQAGGGYLVYVAHVSKAIALETPIQVANPGNGSHVTSTTTSLSPGVYNFAVKAYSSEGTSELSAITNFTVPK